MSIKHLLQEMGVLKQLGIRQQIPIEDFKKIYTKLNKLTNTNEIIQDKFKKILEGKSLEQIPGVITLTSQEQKDDEIYSKAVKIAEFLLLQKMPKQDLAFLINVIVDKVGLKIDDFEKGD